MNKRIYLNNDWQFTENCTEGFLCGGGDAPVFSVRLPHTCREVPYDYFDETLYQMLCGYRRILFAAEDWRDKSVTISFGAAGHYAEVFVNGVKLAEHRCGYTSFSVEIASALRFGEDNLIAVRLDTRESLDQPPFGHVIDYMTYGGLYREAWLDVRDNLHIRDVFAVPTVDLETEGASGSLRSSISLSAPLPCDCRIRQLLMNEAAEKTAESDCEGNESNSVQLSIDDFPVKCWDVEAPYLYMLITQITRGKQVLDEHRVRIGFRSARFLKNGFYLNGRKLKIRGLNRHQSYPYIGYAAPASLQRNDAEILKNELHLNAVRTSHYPQSQHFLDRCDELGLLVFTEIPGWQHIGGSTWKEIAVDNTREMVEQYRNHPSVVLWGVRINESADDHGFYERTNAAARSLDPTRQTSGVRYLKKSELLEDVYAYNDFSYTGKGRGCEPKTKVTADPTKPYLISEYGGHMFPAKMFDSEAHRQEHLLRHAAIQNEICAETDIAGSFGWCFADYNTHKDFGSGDRICYHGVMDMFRNPKPAASLYAAQQEEVPVLFVTSSMDIGEHPAGNPGEAYIISNAETVRMYKGSALLKEYKTKGGQYKDLPHGPIMIDDYVGDGLTSKEGFSPRQAALAAQVLNYSAVHGSSELPPAMLVNAGQLMLRYRMSFEDAYRLYGKYIGSWGESAAEYRFEAVKDGRVISVLTKEAVREIRMETMISSDLLFEGDCYDMSAIRVRMTDQNGNQLFFLNESVLLSAEGPIEIVGPKILQLRGGCGGTYVRTTGETGTAILRLKGPGDTQATVTFTIENEGNR